MTNYCENICACLDATRCQFCFWSQECRDCSECYFSYQLKNCQNCIPCSSLTGKQYHIYNKPATREEYLKTLQLIKSNQTVWDQAEKTFAKIRSESVRPGSYQVNVENCSGDHLQNCRDCIDSFDVVDSENIRHVTSCVDTKDSIWSYSSTFGNSHNALCCVVNRTSNTTASFYIFDSHDLTYCDSCRNSSDLFGCIGVNHGKYAIMNKVYGQHEYETLRGKIIDHMKSTGEWGEFFPLSVAPHPYDDTAGQDWYPLTQAEVEKRGGR